MKTALMIAFHYPPMRGSSGILRTLKFANYLPDYGWKPIVLTAHPRAHPQIDLSSKTLIDSRVQVEFAQAWDAARHLSIRGRYPNFLAWPDRWASWFPGAVFKGLRLIRQQRPSVLWSTYPIATAHLIALQLHRMTGLPWIADFRDPVSEDNYPDRTAGKICRRIERAAVHEASRVVVVTPGAERFYRNTFPNLPEQRVLLLPNGYDEENFRAAEQAAAQVAATPGCRRLVHAGLLYPAERDPRPFFAALAELKKAGVINAANLRIVLRATGHDDLYRSALNELGIADIVELAGYLPYTETLAEMLAADGLLIFQAAVCNEQIPAKLYEYLRARRPILAITDPAGDTAKLLVKVGIDTIARLDSTPDLVQAMRRFLCQLDEGTAPRADALVAARYARHTQAGTLARTFDEVIASRITR